MTELFDDNDEEKAIVVDDELIEVDDVIVEVRHRPTSDARRRLEDLMEDKRLRDELEDFIDEY
ncbi:MAG: hypothetical protein Q8R24_06870 [Legionellaceae bacterium]|nr:hypothetical protein [Legionellaceae bacterium]